MPLFSEHISNMYYGGSPSYHTSHTTPSYGYKAKSSFTPSGTSYSASYLSPGGSYSKHSSISNYSRAPLTPRWIPGISRTYSPLLTTISERSTHSPLRINSPRRIPISHRTYGTPTPTYIQRPININTENIDVSRDRYRAKPAEPSPQASSPPPPQVTQKNDPDKDSEKQGQFNENCPFMPRVDGKPVTEIDSLPCIPRNTIKRGRTVVRLHTIKRKEKDSPRKPDKNIEVNKQDNVDTAPEEPESLSWREKLSEDLIYVDKKEKKSLGTKLVEKFIVKDLNEKDKIEKSVKISDGLSETLPSSQLPIASDVPSTSKSPDRRCSMELLAEQASLLDSLIRGENLSTTTLDLSKIGIGNDPKSKFSSSDSLKRIKLDDAGNPLKTTKSDHSLHDNLNKSIKKDSQINRDLKTLTKRSLKKSHSGGSICRLDSITEFPKETRDIVDLPAIQENRFSPKEQKLEKSPKKRTKITSSVEISPPSSPLKFRIENITVEEKHHTPKKEVSFTYEMNDTPVEDITLQSPNLRRTNERNSVKKKSKKVQVAVPISPEPDDDNFWAKIGKRETVNLKKRREKLEEVREKNKRDFLWFPEDEETEALIEAVTYSINVSNDKSNIIKRDPSTDLSTSDPNTSLKVEKNLELKDKELKTVSYKLEISKSFEKMPPKTSTSNNPSLKEIKTKVITELKHDDFVHEINKRTLVRQDAEIKEETDAEHVSDIKFTKVEATNETNQTKTSLKKIKSIECGSTENNENLLKINRISVSDSKTIVGHNLTSESQAPDEKGATEITLKLKRAKSEGNNLDKNTKTAKSESFKSDDKKSLSSATQAKKTAKIVTLKTRAKSEGKSFEKDLDPMSGKHEKSGKAKIVFESAEKSIKKLTTPVKTRPNTIEPQNEYKTVREDMKPSVEKIDSVESLEVTLQNLVKEEVKPLFHNLISAHDKSKNHEVEKVYMSPENQTIKSTKTEQDVNKVLTLRKQAKDKIEENEHGIGSVSVKPETGQIKDFSKQVNAENTKNTMKNEATDLTKNKNQEKGKELEQKLDTKMDIKGSVSKEKICETCKKPVINVDSSKVQDNEVKTSAVLEKPINDVLEVKSSLDIPVADSSDSSESNATCSKVIETKNIPNEIVANDKEQVTSPETTGEENKAEKGINDSKDSNVFKPPSIKQTKFGPKKPIKEEKAPKTLIATPRPLKKRPPQVIHSDSSDSSSGDESSEEDDSDTSEECGEFYECENNPDGRTSTGSNDSGFDSSAPGSPANFLQIKKDCDVNCHRKCEKLTANLCGVNQRLLVEALATRTASKRGGESPGPSSNASAQSPDSEVGDSELELEQSTVYGIFRKTGKITPPARSIPRFRKYNIEDFQFIKVLGKGSFGKVLLTELRDTEYYYAVKCLKKDVVLEDDDVECTLIERKVLALGTNHPYLCHLFATFQTDSHLFFVMEYLNGGDLMFHIQQSGRFPEARARFYAAEIVSGLKFLHKRGIVYRDLKLDNILLDFEGHVRIADFGMCKLQIYLDKTADTFCGTPDYMAPEIIKGLKYNQTVDWWSFGVLLYEMLIGQSPFSGCDEDELFWSICNEMPSYPRFLSKEALTILTRLLDKDARTRLGGTDCMHGDVKEQDFFYHVHWDKLERRELESPFKPRVRHPLDTQYFDRDFTTERPRLTAVEPHVLRSMDQGPFRGFSYTNPNATDR